MTLFRLLLHNLWYHRRGNSAVLLGVAVGAAVLTGALLVGDSLRGSLQELTLRRLGWVDEALVGGRLVREQLAGELQAGRVSPVILMQGAASRGTADGADSNPDVRRAARVTILGVDDRFWPEGQAPGGGNRWRSGGNEVVLNRALADELHARAGDTITLHLQKVSAIPRETLLGRRDTADVLDRLDVRVAEVLPDEGMANFTLNPTPATPRNAFVPLRALQAALNQKGRVNGILVAGGEGLDRQLREHLTLDDWGLVLRQPKRGKATAPLNYLSLESRQLLLEPMVASAATEAAAEARLRVAPTLVYLANSISDGKHSIPYSVVAALDPAQPPPLGPFLPPGTRQLKDDEIVLADWKDSPLQVKPGDRITLTYYPPEEHSQFREETASFRLAGKIPLTGVADDPNVSPEFPGITDKLSIADWDPPFPYNNKLVKTRDEQYWRRYRTTPKAYVTLAAGERLWRSRFGDLTSIRLAPDGTAKLQPVMEKFRSELTARLDPRAGGLVFRSVKADGLKAGTQGTDFGLLFLGFSCFLIVAALLLVGLLFRLNLDRRGSEIGLLMAAGYRRRTVRRLLLAEGGLLALAGGLLGCAAAVLYARGLLYLLATRWWPGGLPQGLLHFHATAVSFVYGYVATLAVSLLTVWWAVRVLGRVSPSALLAGKTTAEEAGGPAKPARWSRWVAVASAVLGLASLVAGVYARDAEARSSSFFCGGALLLIAGLAAVWAWMRRSRHALVHGHGAPALTRLGVRNAARHPVRSLLTAGLLASATFVVFAVESFHRAPERDYLDKNSGSGGFALLGESEVPIYQDLNTPRGRDELNIHDKDGAALRGVSFYPMRLRQGDDASCLNLYRPLQPRLLGVPHPQIERGGFDFQATAESDYASPNPWRLLEGPLHDGAIPAFGEANTVTWILHSKLGGDVKVRDGQGREVTLRIVGLLQDSVFQSGLLISEANFLKLYPRSEGYNVFLIDVQPPGRSPEVRQVLDRVLADRGFEATATAQRLAEYLAVENMYLSTFQALGGLGLLLGAVGLAVVLLRGVWERRGELALLRAMGFRQATLGWLVLTENGFLLLVGLAIGAVAALLAVLPPVATGAGEVPWQRLAVLLGLVLVVGLAAGAAAVVATLRAPLLPALRRE
jgi:ABC-type lipoprotein release transport system permease subunit